MPITADSQGKCPHCGTTVYFAFPQNSGTFTISTFSGSDTLTFDVSECPSCRKLVCTIQPRDSEPVLVHPLITNRPVPPEVPAYISNDYTEAVMVLSFSPKASAALSRRCLQAVLREAGGASQRDLANQIDAVLRSLPPHIAENLDAIRNIGNFAAHPLKSQSSGEIVDVEIGEAEWTLEVLDSLFEHYYVNPAKSRAKREALNQKLKGWGKPEMKKP